MDYKDPQVLKAHMNLKAEFEKLEDKSAIVRSPELTSLYAQIKIMPAEKRGQFGKEVNALKQEIDTWVRKSKVAQSEVTLIDITAPFDVNVAAADKPKFLPSENGSRHPLMTEIEKVTDIFARMGFDVIESREIDDDFNMFGSLNFPEGHPARDDWDTFMTDEGLIAPAHTSTMQNRVYKNSKPPIRKVIVGRVFRNEDLDARHEHTFYQLEGVLVDENVNVGNIMATLKAFLEEYYGKSLEVKTQPFYFPFTEPSFEFALSCPFCEKKGCGVCSQAGWIELLGCGMIHPNVLKMGGLDPKIYTGFAWGMGIDRLVMMKSGIEDIRHFQSANLKFLRQFK